MGALQGKSLKGGGVGSKPAQGCHKGRLQVMPHHRVLGSRGQARSPPKGSQQKAALSNDSALGGNGKHFYSLVDGLHPGFWNPGQAAGHLWVLVSAHLSRRPRGRM